MCLFEQLIVAQNKIFYVENEESQTFDFNTNSFTRETYVVVNSRSNLEEIIITSPSGRKLLSYCMFIFYMLCLCFACYCSFVIIIYFCSISIVFH